MLCFLRRINCCGKISYAEPRQNKVDHDLLRIKFNQNLQKLKIRDSFEVYIWRKSEHFLVSKVKKESLDSLLSWVCPSETGSYFQYFYIHFSMWLAMWFYLWQEREGNGVGKIKTQHRSAKVRNRWSVSFEYHVSSLESVPPVSAWPFCSH